MPKVGDKQFPYTEEGMAAAQAESEATGLPIEEDDMASELPQEEQPQEEQPQEEPEQPAGELPSEEIISQVYEVVFGSPYDPSAEDAEEQMGLLQNILMADPKLSEMLSSGEMTISQFAVELYRTMEQKRKEIDK